MKQGMRAGNQYTFVCPICGRKILYDINTGKSIPLIDGDTNILHRGRIGSTEISDDLDDPYLAPFSDWMTGR
jgi:hypothetical protein